MSRNITDYESIMQKPYYWLSQKHQQAFISDWNVTISDLEVIKQQMTYNMYQGVASNKREVEIIAKYNKLCRHLGKLKQHLRSCEMTK